MKVQKQRAKRTALHEIILQAIKEEAGSGEPVEVTRLLCVGVTDALLSS
jgi:hypothetical protein